MRTRILNAVLLVALVLAGSRLWQFLGRPPVALPSIKSTEAPPAPATPPGEAAAEVPAIHPEVFDVIVARDLFSPARGVVPPEPTIVDKPAAKPLVAPKLTLYGVVIIDGERVAYLHEGAQDARPKKVKEQDSFAGGVVKAIRPDSITFLFAGSEINVLLRTPKDGAGAPVPRGQDVGGVAAPKPESPPPFPRRQLPAGFPQPSQPGQGRQPPAPAGMPVAAPTDDSGEESLVNEEFPDMSAPPGVVPGMIEEETGE